jgi:hypothetical protein
MPDPAAFWWNTTDVTVASTAVDVSKLDEMLAGFLRAAGKLHSYLFGKPLTITSGNDGNHVQHSAHYMNAAADIRSRDIDAASQLLFGLLLSYIAPTYKVVVFDERATAGEHWHVQTAASAGA